MKFSRLAFLGLLIQFSCLPPLLAQQTDDSLLRQEAISDVHRIYINEIGDNAQIYHGSEYIRNGQKALGFPYYQADSMLTGTISYQGNTYTNQQFFYNLVSDEIIIPNYLHNALLTLSPLKAESFIISDHAFIQLNAKKNSGLTEDGYYEQLYGGDPGLYARRVKKLVVGMGSVDTKYIPYDTYLLKYNDVFYVVDSKNALLEILKDEEDRMKKYIRANKLNFKKNLESSLVLSTIYYSRLKH